MKDENFLIEPAVRLEIWNLMPVDAPRDYEFWGKYVNNVLQAEPHLALSGKRIDWAFEKQLQCARAFCKVVMEYLIT